MLATSHRLLSSLKILRVASSVGLGLVLPCSGAYVKGTHRRSLTSDAGAGADAAPSVVVVRHDGGDVVCAREPTGPEGQPTYVLGLRPSCVASNTGVLHQKKVVFVDLPQVGTQLFPGRPFSMVEGEGGPRLSLKSPVTGEVVEVNERLLRDPGLVGRASDVASPGEGDGGREGRGSTVGDGWLVRLEPYLDADELDPDFELMWEGV